MSALITTAPLLGLLGTVQGMITTFSMITEFGVGRITKQNTTVDVKPGETKRQAAKFGNKVDKDGRPPTLSKKVKGSSTNVLFNLGMAENVEERSLTKGEEKKKAFRQINFYLAPQWVKNLRRLSARVGSVESALKKHAREPR